MNFETRIIRILCAALCLCVFVVFLLNKDMNVQECDATEA